MKFESRNPATGELIRTYEPMGGEAVEAALMTGRRAQRDWAALPVVERASLLGELKSLLESRKDSLARLMTEEMGKPLAQAKAELEKCGQLCAFYEAEAEGFLASRQVRTDFRESRICYRPLGLVLGIMPWNFPFWQAFRFLAPALTAGNGAFLKHAENVTGSALEIENLFREAGYPESLVQTLLVDRDRVGEMIEDDRIQGVSLTGSDRAGREVAAHAGKALKKCVLELGGSDPAIILDDAPLEVAAELCAKSRLRNTGQSCIATKRFIIPRGRLEAFEALLKARFDEQVLGDPLNEKTTLGPLAREDLRENLHRQVTESIEMGARLLRGGSVPEGRGFFYPATLVSEVAPGMPLFDEETFGPAGVIIPAENEEHALELANRTEYGLGATVITRDLERGAALAEERLEAGSCFVNHMVVSDPRLPFGGIRRSGFGRELAEPGIHEFVNLKTVVVEDLD